MYIQYCLDGHRKNYKSIEASFVVRVQFTPVADCCTETEDVWKHRGTSENYLAGNESFIEAFRRGSISLVPGGHGREVKLYVVRMTRDG